MSEIVEKTEIKYQNYKSFNFPNKFHSTAIVDKKYRVFSYKKYPNLFYKSRKFFV